MKKTFLFASLFFALVLTGAGCGKATPNSAPVTGTPAPSVKEVAGERVDFFDDSYGESSTIVLPKDWGYAFSANPSWVTSMKVETFRIFSGAGLEKNHLWVYIVPDKEDEQAVRKQFEKAAKPEIVKSGIKILPSHRFYAEYVIDDEQSRAVFGSIAKKEKVAAPASTSATPIAQEKYAGKWIGLDATTFEGVPATNSVVINTKLGGKGLTGSFVAVLSAAAPAVRTAEGTVSGEFTVAGNSAVNLNLVGVEHESGEAAISYQNDFTLFWILGKWNASGDYQLPQQLILYRDRTDELNSGEKQKMEKAGQAKINADPKYNKKAFAHVEQVLGNFARVGVQTYEGDDVARVYVQQTSNGWEAVTDAVPLSQTDIILDAVIPAPLL